MVRIAVAALILTVACGSSSPLAHSDAEALDGGSDSGSRFDAEAVDGGFDALDAGPDVPETGCGGDRWCWVMGGPVHDIHGVDPSAVFAVGAEGIIRMHDGTVWTDHPSPTRNRIDSVVARSADAVWILTEGASGNKQVWHYDGDAWSLELEDDPSEWSTNMLVLDSDGMLHTARRQYSGSEYWTILRTYVGGAWIVGEYRSVVEANPAESYDALRTSLVAYEHAFDPAYWEDAPAEVWVNGARAAWGSNPDDVVRARSQEPIWERSSRTGFVELAIPTDDAWFYRWPQERDSAVAGFADGSAIVVHARQMFRVTGTSARAWAGPGQPTIRAVDDGRVALAFIDEVDGVATGRVRLHRSETEAREYVIDFDECPGDRWGFRGAPRLVDVDVHDDEIWVSVMMDHSRTGTPCLFHYDGESWAARGVGVDDRHVLQSFGYMITVDGEGALLAGAGSGGAIEIVDVPRAFMRSDQLASSLDRTPVSESAGFREWMSPRIWRGPSGVWLYDDDQALFRAHSPRM